MERLLGAESGSLEAVLQAFGDGRIVSEKRFAQYNEAELHIRTEEITAKMQEIGI